MMGNTVALLGSNSYNDFCVGILAGFLRIYEPKCENS